MGPGEWGCASWHRGWTGDPAAHLGLLLQSVAAEGVRPPLARSQWHLLRRGKTHKVQVFWYLYVSSSLHSLLEDSDSEYFLFS